MCVNIQSNQIYNPNHQLSENISSFHLEIMKVKLVLIYKKPFFFQIRNYSFQKDATFPHLMFSKNTI